MGVIRNSYSTGRVAGENDIGGLIGGDGMWGDWDFGVTENSFYDIQTSGQSDIGRGVGKSTSEMKQIATFVSWNFPETWGIAANINSGYPHLRVWSDWSNWNTTDATCTATGSRTRTRTCNLCSEINAETQIISALGHSWSNWSNWNTTTAATCVLGGSQTRTRNCNSCGEIDMQTQAIIASGHSWENWGSWNITTEATCSFGGSQTRTRNCNSCGETDVQIQAIATLGHNWDSWDAWDTTDVANCIETGNRNRSRACGRCSETDIEAEIIFELGHLLEWTQKTSATCSDIGTERGTCIRENCDHAEERNIPRLNHNWIWSDWDTAKVASCTIEGSRERTMFCSLCGDVNIAEQTISAVGHLWSDWEEIIPETGEATDVKRVCLRTDCDAYEILPIYQTSIRNNQRIGDRYGIVLEKAVVSDIARISVKTPEPAQINMRVFDGLGNVVFETNAVGAYCIRPSEDRLSQQEQGVCNTPLQWDLTNTAGRFVASGTYLIVVEAIGVNGRRFAYSARIGVRR